MHKNLSPVNFCYEILKCHDTITANWQGLLQGWNSLLVRPEPLLNKDIKVQVNKQKPGDVCPAQMKHNSDKMPNCSNVQPHYWQYPLLNRTLVPRETIAGKPFVI